MNGDKYNWWQSVYYGKNGYTYYIASLVLGSIVVFLILFGMICGIVLCCRKAKKNDVLNESQSIRPFNDKGDASAINGNDPTLNFSDQAKFNEPVPHIN